MNEKQGGEPASAAFSWDWRGQPPMEDIARTVAEISAAGQVFMRPYDDGTDSYTWIVSGHQVDDAEAEAIIEAATYDPPGPVRSPGTASR